jgi:hypothetical protein
LETHNLLFFGTLCPAGSCEGIVVNIGDQTVMGRISQITTQTEDGISPIKKEINRFVLLVSAGKSSYIQSDAVVAIIIVGLVFIRSFLFYCLLLNRMFQTNPNKMTNCLKLFSLFTIYNYICSMRSLF